MLARLTLSVAVLALVVGTAAAQTPARPPGQRIAGTVKSVTAGDLVLTTANGDTDLAITPATRVLVRKAATAAEIKPGAYLGTSNQNADDGANKATEVHLMPDGPNVHFAMNNSGLMMTNGHVKSVTKTAKGQEMDVDYGQATTRHVVVTGDTSLTRMEDVGVAALKPGVAVTALANPGPDGKLAAGFVQITDAK